MPAKWRKIDWLWTAVVVVFLLISLAVAKPALIVLAAMAGLILFIRLLLLLGQNMLWKIRNRLIISTLFFTVTPIILLSLLFLGIASFLISQYNSLIFENIMQRNLARLESIADFELEQNEPAKVLADIVRITRREPRFMKLAFYVRRGAAWEIFYRYPADFSFENLNPDLLAKEFKTGYFRWGGNLHQGVFKTNKNLATFVFETVNQEYFNSLPRIGDFKVMYEPVSKGSIVSESKKMTSRLEGDEFAGFEKNRLPFPYDYRYLDLDDVRGSKPVSRTFWFVIINDYSKLFQRLRGSDSTASLRQEIQSLQKEIQESPAGRDRDAKVRRLEESQRELFIAERRHNEGGANLIPILIKVMIGLIAFFIVCSIFIGFRIISVITRSVNQLTKGIEKMRKGDFSFRIKIKSHDQMHYLAESFNEMASGIDRLLKEEKERHRLEEELRIARSIQLKLLPQDTFLSKEFSIAAVNIPAQEIAGDYFDYFYHPEHFLTLLVADVSGKGASAAFYMAELKGIMNYLQAQEESPREMIGKCHDSLLPSFDKVTFITMNLVRFDIARRRFVFARAGHTPALFYDARAGQCRELMPAGPAIGMAQFSRDAIEQIEMEFQSGDIMFFFSDGLSEIMNSDGEVFGISRLKKILEDHAASTAQELRQKILDSSSSFSQDKVAHDDLTFVVIKIP